MTAAERDRRLPCGRTEGYLLELVADEAADGTGQLGAEELAHLAGCPHCTARLESLRRGWAAVHQVAAAPIPVPPELVGRTLATLRALRGPTGAEHMVIPQVGGVTRVADRVVVLLARTLATELLDGYRRSRGGAGPARVLAIRGDHEALTVDVALPYGEPVPGVADWLRHRLGELLDQQLGSSAPSVTVHVADIG